MTNWFGKTFPFFLFFYLYIRRILDFRQFKGDLVNIIVGFKLLFLILWLSSKDNVAMITIREKKNVGISVN